MTHAIRIHETGGPEVLRWEEVEVGDPARARCGSATPPSASTSSTLLPLRPLPVRLPASLGAEAPAWSRRSAPG